MVKDFVMYLLEGNNRMCLSLATNYLEKKNIIDLYDNLIRESLYEIGRLWEFNQISVAEEHVVTVVVESVIGKRFKEPWTDSA